MQKFIAIGNLTRDPELTETNGGISVCHFSIAVNRSYTDSNGERQTDFFNCTAWRGLAETIARYCKKGGKVAVTGSIQIRNYEDNQGIKRIAVDVIVQDCEFLTPHSGDRESDFYNASSPTKKPVLQEFDDDGDIPF